MCSSDLFDQRYLVNPVSRDFQVIASCYYKTAADNVVAWLKANARDFQYITKNIYDSDIEKDEAFEIHISRALGKMIKDGVADRAVIATGADGGGGPSSSIGAGNTQNLWRTAMNKAYAAMTGIDSSQLWFPLSQTEWAAQTPKQIEIGRAHV